MKTSYFRVAGEDPNAIAISRGTPKFFQGPQYLPLCPTWDMIRRAKEGDKDYYWDKFFEMLDRLDPGKVYDQLCSMVEGEPILLCYEKDWANCHRRFVARWFKKELGIEVEESESLKVEQEHGDNQLAFDIPGVV